jgi:predicted transcriptional regulator
VHKQTFLQGHIMSDVTVTVRMSKNLRDRLEILSAETRRSKSFLGMEAIQHYVETEEEIILGIKRGLADVKAGRTVPHSAAMKRIRATIDSAAKKKKSA